MRRRNNTFPVHVSTTSSSEATSPERSSSSTSTVEQQQPGSPATFTTTPTEEIPTPYPTPARAIFGFVLHCFGIVFLVVYAVWLWVPTPILTALGITYVPAKLWAILLPLAVPLLLTVYVVGLSLRNAIVFHRVFDDIKEVAHDFKDD